MRVLHVIAEMAAGGAERVVISLTGGGVNEAAVAAAPGPLSERLSCPQFPLPLIERRTHMVPLAAWRLRRAIGRWQPDVVHCHNPGMALVTRLARGPRVRSSSLVSVHGLTATDYPRAARLLRFTGMPVVACGPGVADALAEQGLDVRTTIVNGISPPPESITREALARELNIPAERALIVCAGRLVPLKNIDVVIAAMVDVPNAVLLVVGDGPERGRLEAVAGEIGIPERVVFAGHREDARRLVGAADVVVLASSSEGLPLLGLEALAAARPLVATDVRGVRELVRDGEDGLLVQPRDAVALAAAVRRLLAEPALARRLASHGASAAAPFTEEAMVQAFDALYAELLAGARA